MTAHKITIPQTFGSYRTSRSGRYGKKKDPLKRNSPFVYDTAALEERRQKH